SSRRRHTRFSRDWSSDMCSSDLIPMLVHWFLERLAPGDSIQVTSAAMKALLQYDWPGNVRELENCMERAVALGDRRRIDMGDLPPSLISGSQAMDSVADSPSSSLSS